MDDIDALRKQVNDAKERLDVVRMQMDAKIKTFKATLDQVEDITKQALGKAEQVMDRYQRIYDPDLQHRFEDKLKLYDRAIKRHRLMKKPFQDTDRQLEATGAEIGNLETQLKAAEVEVDDLIKILETAEVEDLTKRLEILRLSTLR